MSFYVFSLLLLQTWTVTGVVGRVYIKIGALDNQCKSICLMQEVVKYI